MAARLTDKEKKQIIAAYIECGSYRAVGRRFNISATTVKTLVLNDQSTVQKCAEKKAENTQSVLEYMDNNRDKAINIINCCLAMLPEKLKNANASQTATVLGIIIDKYTKQTESPQSKAALDKLDNLLGEFKDAVGGSDASDT